LSTDAEFFHGQVVIVQNNTILKKWSIIKKIDGIDKVTRVYKT
jgi:GTP pyrophosphokinase